MSILYYFGYGSNLHPLRLLKRVPSARFKGIVSVPGYQLTFHKRHHQDGSGKCNMLLTNDNNDVVYGAVYEMKSVEKPLLDQCEGEGYRCDTLNVEIQDTTRECFVYIAEDSHIDDALRPHSWYQQIVLLGAEHHQLPEEYIDRIRIVEFTDDPDRAQHERHNQLIKEMRAYSEGRD